MWDPKPGHVLSDIVQATRTCAHTKFYWVAWPLTTVGPSPIRLVLLWRWLPQAPVGALTYKARNVRGLATGKRPASRKTHARQKCNPY